MRLPRGAGPRPLIVLLCGIGIACGGGGSTAFRRDAGPDAIAGSKLLRTLNPNEGVALCNEMVAYVNATPFPTSDFCRSAGYEAALGLLLPDISDAMLQSVCVVSYADCLSRNADAGVAPQLFLPCSPVSSGCQATVDQYLACIAALLEMEHARLRALPLCHLLTRNEIEGRFFDAGVSLPPPSCDALVSGCFSPF